MEQVFTSSNSSPSYHISNYSLYFRPLSLPTLPLQGFEVSTPIRDEGCADDDNIDDDDDNNNDDDGNKENIPVGEKQENPWKLSKDEVAFYDEIFPEAASGGNTKSEKNKVIARRL